MHISPKHLILVFMNIMGEFICGEGIHKSDSYAIISDFLCRAFYLVIPKCIPNVASSVYPVLTLLTFLLTNGEREARRGGMILFKCP